MKLYEYEYQLVKSHQKGIQKQVERLRLVQMVQNGNQPRRSPLKSVFNLDVLRHLVNGLRKREYAIQPEPATWAVEAGR